MRSVKAEYFAERQAGDMLYAPNLTPPLVVIVDDDAAVRAALEFTLELEGFDVVSCSSGEALLLRDLPPKNACLLVDERLPGITGLDALNQLRRREVKLPAILMTSHPNASVRASAKAAGIPILEKPLLGDALTVAIRDALFG